VLTLNGSPVVSTKSGAVEPILLAVDPSGTTLWVADYGIGIVSAFAINTSTGVLTPESPTFTVGGAGYAPVGVAIAQTATKKCLSTANQGNDSVTPQVVSGAFTLTIAPKLSGLNAPIEVIADPQSLFFYATESGSANVIQMSISSSNCHLTTVTTTAAGNGPYGMALTH